MATDKKHIASYPDIGLGMLPSKVCYFGIVLKKR
jgi:hypothetical protein